MAAWYPSPVPWPRDHTSSPSDFGERGCLSKQHPWVEGSSAQANSRKQIQTLAKGMIFKRFGENT